MQCLKVEQKYHEMMGLGSDQAWGMNSLAGVLRCALLIIATLGVSGTLPVSTVGFCALGLGGAEMVVQLLGGNLTNRKYQLIMTGLVLMTVIALGALGSTGSILSAQQLGYGLIGTAAAAFTFFCFGVRGWAAKQAKLNTENREV